MRYAVVFCTFVVIVLGCVQNAFAQTAIWRDSASVTSFNTWQHTARWQWKANGKANAGAFWGNRRKIAARTPNNGAFVLDADASGVNVSDTLTSPVISFFASNVARTFYVRVRQYARTLNSTFKFGYSIPANGGWTDSPANTNLTANYETARYDEPIIAVVVPANADNMQIRLVFQGQYYFWIVDDFAVFTAYPSPTVPAAVGTYLFNHNYPFAVDSLSHPYVKHEMAVQFKPNVTAAGRDSVRAAFHLTCVRKCLCDTLDDWHLAYVAPTNNPDSTVHSIGIEENVKGATTKNEIKSVEPNYYQYDVLTINSGACHPNAKGNLVAVPAGVVAAVAAPVRVAVLDTGIDYTPASVAATLYLNPAESINNADDDGNCVKDDVIGYNFAYPKACNQLGNNNPADDHSHGSHVTGIVRNTVAALSSTVQPACSLVQYLPVKTHDSLGIGTLFSTTCGVYYAVKQGAKVLNCSWGYYAVDETHAPTLRNAILYAHTKRALVVGAAGNDSLTIASPNVHFPSSYRLPNVIGVACIDAAHTLSAFSNRSVVYVDVATGGESINSNVLCGAMGVKSGTSMSAPVVTGIAAWKYCNLLATNTGAIDSILRNEILGCHTTTAGAGLAVATGGYLELPLNASCITPTESVFAAATSGVYAVRPNLVAEGVTTISVTALDYGNSTTEPLVISIYDAVGRQLFLETVEYDALPKRIDVAGFAKGVYFISILQKDGYLWASKFIKE